MDVVVPTAVGRNNPREVPISFRRRPPDRTLSTIGGLDGAKFEDDMSEFQAVDCQTVHVGHRNLWWTCMVRHSDVRIETLPFRREDVQRLRQGFEKCGISLPDQDQARQTPAIHPAVQKIYDLLYLDEDLDGRAFYDPDRDWDSGVLSEVACIILDYIPLPPPVKEEQQQQQQPPS